MNENTKAAFHDFIVAVEQLTVSVVRETGTEQAGKIIDACDRLKFALESDETLP